MALDLLPQLSLLWNRVSQRTLGDEVARETRPTKRTTHTCGLDWRFLVHIKHMQFPYRLDLGGFAVSMVKLADTGPTYRWVRGHRCNGDMGALWGQQTIPSSRAVQFLFSVGRLHWSSSSRFTCTKYLLPAALIRSFSADRFARCSVSFTIFPSTSKVSRTSARPSPVSP